jgi:hypothetical protein
MGFMDKAKKMAEQAQTKLDEAQKQFNSGQAGQQAGGGPVVEYDKHGRPIQPTPVTPDAAAPVPPTSSAPPTATPGVPATEPPQPPAPAAGPTPDPASPPTPGSAPTSPPSPPGPGAPEDRNRPSTEAPKLSSGDPLAG